MERVEPMPLPAGTDRVPTPMLADLAKRAFSTLVALPILLALVVWAPAWAFAGLVIVVGARAQWELLLLFERAGHGTLRWLGVLLGAIVTASFIAPMLAPAALTLAVLVLVAAPLWRPAGAPVDWRPAAVTLFSVCYVSWLLGYAVPLRAGEAGVEWLLLLLLVTWTGETAAYLVGRTLGRHRLAPTLSPRKTVEGAVAQVAGSALAALVAQAWFHPTLAVGEAAALGALLGTVGQVGDLGESALKRSLHAKDAGGLLPGHGGMLDRIDSLLFNTPVLFCYAAWGRTLGS
jgi:phosphatidate cytidylyltransferase